MKYPEAIGAAFVTAVLVGAIGLTQVRTPSSEGGLGAGNMPITNPVEGEVGAGQQSQSVTGSDQPISTDTPGEGADGTSEETDSAEGAAAGPDTTSSTATPTATDSTVTGGADTGATEESAGSESDAQDTSPTEEGASDEAAPAAGAAESSAGDAAGDPAAGQEIFAGTCGGCHGPQGQGGIGPAMTENANSWDLAGFSQTLREGLTPDGRELAPTMPRYSEAQLSDADITNIHAWVQSL